MNNRTTLWILGEGWVDKLDKPKIPAGCGFADFVSSTQIQ
jgi:hypothetical protein